MLNIEPKKRARDHRRASWQSGYTVIEQTKKLIEAVLAGEIDTAWAKDLRKAVDDPNNCTKIAAFVVHVIDLGHRDGDHDPAPTLAHGIVKYSPYDTPKFHAWAEIEGTVIDLTLPPPARFSSRDRYYALKGIETTRRYSSVEISINLIRHGHYGPWDDESFADQSLFR